MPVGSGCVCGVSGDDVGLKAYSGLALGSHTFQVRAVDSRARPALRRRIMGHQQCAAVGGLDQPGWREPDERSVGAVDGRVLDERDRRRSDGLRAREDGFAGVVGCGDDQWVGRVVHGDTGPTGTGDGSVGLNLVDNDSIAATSGGVKLGGIGIGNGNFTGQVFAIDKTPPANAPTITSGPAASSFVARRAPRSI